MKFWAVVISSTHVLQIKSDSWYLTIRNKKKKLMKLTTNLKPIITN